VQPFQHLVNHPQFLFLGQGYARLKISGNFLLAGANAANHAVFAASYYGYGMFAAFSYVLLLVFALRDTWNYSRNRKQKYSSIFSRALMASLSGFSSWFLLTLGAIIRPHGAMLLFFVFALADVQKSLHEQKEVVK
jgi:hypothetical protein